MFLNFMRSFFPRFLVKHTNSNQKINELLHIHCHSYPSMLDMPLSISNKLYWQREISRERETDEERQAWFVQCYSLEVECITI